MTDYLTLDSLLQVAEAAIDGEAHVRDYGLLESAVARPRMTVFGADAYPSILEKVAAFLESLVRNHALVDGNKRLGWLATETFLLLSGFRVTAADDAIFDLVIAVAEGRFAGVAEIGAALAGMVESR